MIFLTFSKPTHAVMSEVDQREVVAAGYTHPPLPVAMQSSSQYLQC